MIFTVFYRVSYPPAALCSGALTIRADTREDAIDYARRKVTRIVPDCTPDRVEITSTFTLSEISQCARP